MPSVTSVSPVSGELGLEVASYTPNNFRLVIGVESLEVSWR